ncbi:S8 family peptidase [Micromonospora sp. NPDC049559]|uniref:S8 family peptidase n=1 Tax=Micromonospora sp. NPDC049559 TaxID=3155923 RepID=UPI00344770E3
MTFVPSAVRPWRLGVAAAATVAAVGFGTPAHAMPAEGQILRAGGATAVAGSYIVVFKDTAVSRSRVPTLARDLAERHGGKAGQTYSDALRGFEARMSEKSARQLAADPAVKYVEQNHTVSIAGTQSPTPSWGLDRIDQRNLPLNNSYTYPNEGSGVRAYVLDTGIRFSHSEFGGGRAVSGYDAIDGGTADDGNGHGTHVAGTIGGRTYGVAKNVTLVGVRVLDNGGSGTYGQIISGVDWVTRDHDPGELAVANMSLSGPRSQALNDAVAASIADGVVYGLAAGNDYGRDACNLSPASTAAAITVGASNSNDTRADYSNIGSCLDLFAPGTGITSSYNTSDAATAVISGTSMATPHVVGAAALVLASNPTFTPAQVRDKLFGDATPNKLPDAGVGSPNRLLYTGSIAPPPQDFKMTVTPTTGQVNWGGTLSVAVGTTNLSGEPQPVNLSVAGLPSGVTASFSPSSISSGGSSTLTFTAAPNAAVGEHTVTVTGVGSVATRIATFLLKVADPSNCTLNNSTPVAIPDLTTAESSVTISGCARAPRTNSTVEVHVQHTYKGDLVVSLIAPDGTVYVLQNRDGGSADNIDETFTVNLSGEVADGTWRLRVQDASRLDSGQLNGWTLGL